MARARSFDADRVIDRCLEVFWLKGYHATSISDLTAATGVNRKSLYMEFGDKETLFRLALARYCERRACPLLELLEREPLGERNLADVLDYLPQLFDSKGCMWLQTVCERESSPDSAFREALSVMSLFHAKLGANIAVLACSADAASRLADVFCAVISGLSSMSRAGRPDDAIRGVGADALRLIVRAARSDWA